MCQKHQHRLNILFFNDINDQSIYVKIAVYDAVSQKEFHEEVRFLDGMLYGDAVHPSRSMLSPECRDYVRELLLSKYHNGAFH